MSHTHIEHHQPAPGGETHRASQEFREFLPILENRHSYSTCNQRISWMHTRVLLWFHYRKAWRNHPFASESGHMYGDQSQSPNQYHLSKVIHIYQTFFVSCVLSHWLRHSCLPSSPIKHIAVPCLFFFVYVFDLYWVSWVSVYWVNFLTSKNSFGQKRTADHCITCSNTSFVNSLSFSSH